MYGSMDKSQNILSVIIDLYVNRQYNLIYKMWKRRRGMKKTELWMEETLYEFYRKIGVRVGKTAEQVMADALFRFAGEASLRAIDRKKRG